MDQKALSNETFTDRKGSEDTELLFRIKEGDRDALGNLIDIYQKRILSVAYKITGNWHTSQDIAQDVFVTLIEKLDTVDPERNFFSWIYRVAINRSIDHLRSKGREKNSLEAKQRAPVKRTLSSEDLLIKSEMRKKVQEVLEQLPLKYRTALVLRDIEGISTDRIAEILELVPATARWRIHQARRIFRDMWDQEGEEYGLQ